MERVGRSNDSGDAHHGTVRIEKTVLFEFFFWVKGKDAMLYHPQ